jgi:hypothetical protein
VAGGGGKRDSDTSAGGTIAVSPSNFLNSCCPSQPIGDGVALEDTANVVESGLTLGFTRPRQKRAGGGRRVGLSMAALNLSDNGFLAGADLDLMLVRFGRAKSRSLTGESC